MQSKWCHAQKLLKEIEKLLNSGPKAKLDLTLQDVMDWIGMNIVVMWNLYNIEADPGLYKAENAYG